MTLGLPPAGIFWQPAGGSPSSNSLPSLLRSFVPRSGSAHLGAVRESRREGTGGPASAPSRPPGPPPAPPPLPRTFQWEGYTKRRLTPRLPGRCHPFLVGAAEPRNQILSPRCAHAARIHAWRHAERRVSPLGLSSRGWQACVRLGNCKRWKKGRPVLPRLHLREEKAPLSVFDSCPKLHRPGSSRRRRQLLLIQGAGHRRKSIRDKNQLLPECAAAIDTRARRVAPFSTPGSSSNSDGGGGREDEAQTPQATVFSPGLKLRVPD